MVSFSTTGLLLHVALFRLGTTHDCAIGQPGPSILSSLPAAVANRGAPMRRIGLAVVLAASLLTPLAEAQQTPGKVRRVGVLSPGKPPPDDAFHQRDRFEAG